MSELLRWWTAGCCSVGGSLVWTSPSGVVALGAALLGLAFLLAARPFSRSRSLEYLFSALGALLLLLALAGPIWLQEREREDPGRFVVLVDSSRSMSVEEDGAPRAAAVERILAQLGAAEVYHFADGLAPGLPTDYQGADTDLGGALAALSQRHAGERLEGVAILSDGLDRGGLRRRLLGGQGQVLPRLGGPLTVYQVGDDRARVDAAVVELHGADFAFLRAESELSVDVRVSGTQLAELPVTLTRDGQPAGRRTVRLDAEGRGTAVFPVRAMEVGRYVYEASVPLVEGDAVPANNSAQLVSRVVRERVRVLQVCGAPSWDQKFLRLFLKEDPGVDLVSFFILRTGRDMGSGYRGDELALIEFPYIQLFTDDLDSFDLVIFQNFDHAPYFERDSDTLLQNLADYVRGGKSLVMIGGDRSFDLGTYAETPLAGVLPVGLGVTGDPVNLESFQATLTEAGARHPITQLVSEPGENQQIWSKLSALDGLNLSTGASPGAAVLLAHPRLVGPDGVPLPVLAVGEYGKGRTMALMGDSSWRWFLGEASEGRGNQAYLRFWKNSMRWLAGDPEDRPVAVTTDKENYLPAEPVKILVQARNVAFSAIAGAVAFVEVDGPKGRTTHNGVAGPDGSAVVTLGAQERGAYRVSVRVTGPDGVALGAARTVFAVSARDPELEEVAPDEAFLRALAEAVGGRYVGPGSNDAPLRDVGAARRVSEREETALHRAPLLFTGIVLFWTLSWLLRRRAGLR